MNQNWFLPRSTQGFEQITISPQSIELLTNHLRPLLQKSLREIVLVEGLSAFLGVLFPVLIGVIIAFFAKIRERKIKHYNALIFFEGQLNDYLGILHDDIYLIDFFVPAISNGHVYWSELHTLPIDKSKLSDLHNIDLINELNDYYYGLRKINDDIEGLSHGYNDLKNALINRLISPEDYIINARMLAENLLLIKSFLIANIEKTIILLAKIRIVIRRDRDSITKIVALKIDSELAPYIFDKKELKNEVNKLKQEIKDTEKSSRTENENIRKARSQRNNQSKT
mgnify:FL=1